MVRAYRVGFSLVELLVVIGVMGLLLSLLMPAVQASRGVSLRLACLNNLRQIGLGLHSFHDAHGRFPPHPIHRATARDDPNVHLGWMALLLPQMDQESLYRTSVEACRVDTNTEHNPPHVGLATVVRSYVCPADGRVVTPRTDRLGVTASFTSYLAIGGVVQRPPRPYLEGTLGVEPGIRLSDIIDGTSSTIVVGERPPPDSFQAGWWYSRVFAAGYAQRGPNNFLFLGGGALFINEPCGSGKGTFGPGRTANPCDRFHLWSLHSGGANFLFADASARFLPYSAERLMFALGSRSGGEVVELP